MNTHAFLKANPPGGRPVSPVTIGRYTGSIALKRHRMLCYAALALFAAIYGVVFALYGRFMLVQLLYPLVPAALVVIWLLPNTDRAPLRALDRLLIAFLFALLCWPDYLAFALPGLPWITAIRLVTVPLALTLLISLSVSERFRTELKETLAAAPWMWKLLTIFMVTGALTIALSADKALSLNKFTVAQLAWVTTFFASVYVFRRPGRVRLFAVILWLIVLYQLPIVFYEISHQRLPWAGRIPSFLVVEDERIQRLLAGTSARATTGIYRTQSKFTTALGLGEFLALTTPFVFHLMMTARRFWVRIAAGLTMPLIFYMVIRCDSRLAVIGFFMTILLYILVWGVMRWRGNPKSLFGPALVLLYPVLFAAFIGATFLWRRLEVMVWGGGAQQASTEARKTMYREGLPIVMKNPFGHGMGQGAEALGFRNPAGVLTIDTYYMLVALEYGVIGFCAFYGMILYGIFKSGQTLYQNRSREIAWLAPIGIALCNFFIIKSVFSQQENHPLVFIMLGIIVALVWRSKEKVELSHSSAAQVGRRRLRSNVLPMVAK